MPSADLVLPVRMTRIALVAARARVRETLVEVARQGCIELVGVPPAPEGEAVEAVRRLARAGAPPSAPVLAVRPPTVAVLEQEGRADLLAGEVELDRRARLALDRGSFSAWVGWAPADRIEPLNECLARSGAAVVELSQPAWVEPPTLFRPAALARPFLPLVSTYGTARYRDIDPTAFTALSFVLMFGMMFGDVGHGSRARRARPLVPRPPPRAARAVAGVLADPVRGRPRGRLLRPPLRRVLRADRASCRGSGSTRSTGRCRCCSSPSGWAPPCSRSATCSGS